MSAENWTAPEERPNWRPIPEPGRQQISWWVWVLLIVLVSIAAGAGYYFWKGREVAVVETPIALPPVTTAPPEAQKPEIRHPVPQADVEPDKPLPALDQSDAPVGEVLAKLLGHKGFNEFIFPREIVRRVVVTVDNLPRKVVPMRMRVVKPVPGQFASGAQNAARYDAEVNIFEALDTHALVRAYARLYPLFENAYAELGQSDTYFNDRVVEAIDDMLAAPELKSTPQLIQPKVLYLYAEPDLEGRSAGQKILMRMGAANAVKVKAKLREIRRELASGGPAASESTTKQ
jgi:hypothetical protein